MATGPYTITEGQLDKLLSTDNTVFKTAPTQGSAITNVLNSGFYQFKAGLALQEQVDTSGMSATMASGTKIASENPTASSTMDFTSNKQSDLILINASAGANVNLDDLGNTSDPGDYIVDLGSNNDYIKVERGSNFLLAGQGKTTLDGSNNSGDDTMWGGGQSSLVAGSGNDILKGGLSTLGSSQDTLIGGSGHDALTVFHGNNSLLAGTGFNTLTGGTGEDTLSDTLVTGGFSSIVAGSGTSTINSGDYGHGDTINLTHGGSSFVSISGGSATDSVSFGGTAGSDTIVANGAVAISVAASESLKSISEVNGVTTLKFTDGQALTYSGTGNVTIKFNH